MLHCAVEHLCSCTPAFGWNREAEIQWHLLFCNLGGGGPDCFWKLPCSLGATDVPTLHCEQYCIQTLLGKRCVIGTHWIVSVSDSINGQFRKIIYKKSKIEDAAQWWQVDDLLGVSDLTAQPSLRAVCD